MLETVYGLSQGAYAAIFAVNAADPGRCPALVFRQVVHRTGATPLRARSASALATRGRARAGGRSVVAERHALPPLFVPWVLLVLRHRRAWAWCMPATTTLAQEAGRRSRGTAAALQGGLSPSSSGRW